jgi:hypothetical protein
LQGNPRIVAKGGDKILAVYGAELDVFQAGGGDFLAGGFKANAQGPPVIGV